MRGEKIMKYIKAEIFRIFHTRNYLKFIAATTLILLGSMIYSSIDSNSGEYFESMETFLKIVSIIISIFFSVTIFKKKDIKVELLSMGLSRKHIFVCDLITLQIFTIFSIVIMGGLILLFSLLKNLVGADYIGRSYIGFVYFLIRMIVLMINVNNGVMGLTYLLNNVALGIATSFVIIPSVFQIGMYMTEGKIYDVFNNLLLIQPFKLLDLGLATEQIGNGFMKTAGISFVFVFVIYLMCGYVRFSRKEIN